MNEKKEHNAKDFDEIMSSIFELEENYELGSTMRDYLFEARKNINHAKYLRRQCLDARGYLFELGWYKD